MLKNKNVFNIDNILYIYIYCASKIRMISEGSCDTEDWNNNDEIQLLIKE